MSAGVGGGGPVYWPYEEDLRKQERKEPRKFQVGDKVRMKSKSIRPETWSSKLGYVVRIVGDPYKKSDMDNCIMVASSPHRGVGNYFAPQDLELIEPAEPQESFDIDQWRKNLKPGDKVRVVENPQEALVGLLFINQMNKWRGRVVTLQEIVKGYWRIEEDQWRWHPSWFEPVEKPKLSKPKKTKEPQKQPPDPRPKNLIQTALNLVRTIETTFKDSEKYPIFGMNLTKQEPEEKNQSSRLNDCFSSLGVVLYHLYTGESEHNNHSYLLDGYSKPEDMPEGFWGVVNKLLKGEYRSLSEFKEDLKQTNMDSP